MLKALRTIYASLARTASPTPVEVQEFWRAETLATVQPLADDSFDGVRLIIDVTAITLTPSVVFNVEGFDDLSGKWYLLLASAAITAVGTTVLTIGPGMPVTVNVGANAVLPRRWRVRPVHGDADSITYSVGAQLWGAE